VAALGSVIMLWNVIDVVAANWRNEQSGEFSQQDVLHCSRHRWRCVQLWSIY